MPGNAYYNSVQNLLSSSFLTKNIKIKLQKCYIFDKAYYHLNFPKLGEW
jgi:hypothetical protein